MRDDREADARHRDGAPAPAAAGRPTSLDRRCRFATPRLSVESWRSRLSTGEGRTAFAARLVEILRPEVARTLPPAWQRIESVGRALERIDAASLEGDAFAVTARDGGAVVGCLFLYPVPVAGETGRIDVRVGYFLAQETWGRGIGSELVAGLVDWCDAAGDIRTLIGVVEDGNAASARVLEKNGFERAAHDADTRMTVFERRPAAAPPG